MAVTLLIAFNLIIIYLLNNGLGFDRSNISLRAESEKLRKIKCTVSDGETFVFML